MISILRLFRYTEVNGIPLYSYAKIEVPIFSTDLQHYLYELSLLTQHKLATKKKDADKLNKLQVETMYKKFRTTYNNPILLGQANQEAAAPMSSATGVMVKKGGNESKTKKNENGREKK